MLLIAVGRLHRHLTSVAWQRGVVRIAAIEIHHRRKCRLLVRRRERSLVLLDRSYWLKNYHNMKSVWALKSSAISKTDNCAYRCRWRGLAKPCGQSIAHRGTFADIEANFSTCSRHVFSSAATTCDQLTEWKKNLLINKENMSKNLGQNKNWNKEKMEQMERCSQALKQWFMIEFSEHSPQKQPHKHHQ